MYTCVLTVCALLATALILVNLKLVCSNLCFVQILLGQVKDTPEWWTPCIQCT